MLEGELQDEIEIAHHHGFYFRPPEGAEGVTLAVLGDPDHRVMLAPYSRRLRPVGTCEPGEGGIYGGASWVLHVDADNIVRLGGGEGRSPGASDGDDALGSPALELHPDGSIVALDKSGEQRMRISPEGVITLGGAAAARHVAVAELVESALTTLKSAISGAATVSATPGDGGAAFKANILAALSTWPPTLEAPDVEVD
jgi:hypothetical protein